MLSITSDQWLYFKGRQFLKRSFPKDITVMENENGWVNEVSMMVWVETI